MTTKQMPLLLRSSDVKSDLTVLSVVLKLTQTATINYYNKATILILKWSYIALGARLPLSFIGPVTL